MVPTEIESTPLVDRIGDDAYRQILDESRKVLARYQTADGAPMPIEGLYGAETR